ncbi:myosin light chain kinase, smooth muscle-like isoform X2 [Narcine bancroftii]|uniref:myosin light chain kinase, smooth muscle-like isoform X2 n=1 Tax=Narcine bancroftii TaxID=1343680 RepID=UPI0038319D00
MADVTIAQTTTRVSKTTLTLERPQMGTYSPEAPAFTLPPRNLRIPIGGMARFDGKVRGHPEPHITWYKNGQLVPKDDRFIIEQSSRGTFSFIIKEVQKEDAGKFTCETANVAGVRQVTVELTVNEETGRKYGWPSNSSSRYSAPSVENRPSIWGESPPKFVTKPTRLIVKEGQNGKFSCKITGRPQPQVTWLKNDVKLQKSDHFNVFEKSGIHFLEICTAQPEDAGHFVCLVMNNSGKAMATAELTIQSKDSTAELALVHPRSNRAETVEILETKCAPANDIQVKKIANANTSHLKENVKVTKSPAAPFEKQNYKNEERIDKKQESKPHLESKAEEKYAKPYQKEINSLTIQEPQEERKKVCFEQKVQGIITTPKMPSQNITVVSKQQSSKSLRATPKQQMSQIITTAPKQQSSENFATNAKQQMIQSNTTVSKEQLLQSNSPAPTQQKTQWSTTEPIQQKSQIYQKSISITALLPSCKIEKQPFTVAKDAPGRLLEEQKEVGSQMNVEGCQTLQHSQRGIGRPHQQEESKKFADQKSITGESPSEFLIGPQNQTSLEGEEPKFRSKSSKSKEMPPVFTSKLKECIVSEGQDFVLQCSVNGKPQPRITWLVNDKPFQYAHDTFEDGIAKLSVQDALPEDDAIYTCIAENKFGRVSCSAKVTVKERKITEKAECASLEESKKTFAPVFLRKLRDLQVMDGSQVRMSVEVAANPPPEVIWLHNGKEIQESEDFQFEKNGNEYNLFIQEVFPEDTGKYTCEAWNDLGEIQTQAILTVQEPQDGTQPWFISKPKAVTSSLGERVLVSCAIAGDPFPTIKWMKDGKEVVIDEGCKVFQNDDVFTLLIKNVKSHHAGLYEIQLNKVQVNTNIFEKDGCGDGIEDFDKPDFTKKSIAETKANTNDEKAFCGVLRRKVATKVQSAEQLKQQEAEQKDFRCVLGKKVITKSFSEEELKERTAEQMNFRDSLSRHVKTTNSFEEEKKISSPQQVDFRAVLGKKSIPKISPQEASTLKQTQPDFRNVLGPKKRNSADKGTDNDTDRIQSVKVDVNDGGDCKDGCSCIDDGLMEEKSEITNSAPSFTEMLKDAQIADGERLLLQCRVVANPPPVVTWTINGKAIKSSKFINISQEGSLRTLTIEEVLPEDEGQYRCIAENSAGKMECTCSVTVVAESKSPQPTEKRSKTKFISSPTSETDCAEATIKKKPTPKTPPKPAVLPQILQCPGSMKVRAGESAELFCKLAGTPPLSYTWLKFRKQIKESDHIKIENTDCSSKLIISSTKHDDCGCYYLLAENKTGSKQVQVNLTIVDRPEPPAGKPCSSDIRSSTLTLCWYGPTYDGGSVVQSYNVEIWNSEEKQWTHLTTCRSTSCSVCDLNPDKEYKFRVRAVNVYGTSEPSQESDLVKVGVTEEHKEEVDLSDDDDKEGEPDYRDVTINTNKKVAEYYDILEKIGTGKFGQVFKLVEKKTKKVWAGKFFKAFSAKDKENVRQEISIMNCLHHPKLVQCVDAFESRSDIVMVLEIVSGGELFERIIDEDFELTERECIKYMLQINEGVQYIHKQEIVHLDLKPENIMCVNKTGARIKLIDFGLARRLESTSSLKVLFGTPEFVAPEVINYEPIGYATDMWSIGVICYILVSGLSPFMGDNDNETLANVTSATWDFDDEAFDEISDDAKDFIRGLLKKDMKQRLNCNQCLEHKWLKKDVKNMAVKKLSKERMKKYMARRKWQKTGHAVRAIGRLSSMAMLAGLSGRKSSLGSTPASPQASTEKPETEADEPNVLLEAVSEERQSFKPYFSKSFQDIQVIESSAARFDCKIEGYPDPEVIWFKDEQPIKESRHYQIEYDEDGNCSLLVSEVSERDDGKYTCKAINSLGEATWAAELIVQILEEDKLSNT